MRLLQFAAAGVLASVLFAQEPRQEAPPEQPEEYGGPAILSRGGGTSINAPGEAIRFRPFVGVNGIYDSGLLSVSTDAQGNLRPQSSYGVEADTGVYGYRPWKRTVVGLDYRGRYRHYSSNSYYDGTDQLLSLGVSHRFTPRLTLMVREAAGSYARNFHISGAFNLIDPLFANVPRDELFDGRVFYLSTLGDLTYQKSVRLSFNLGGDQFLVRHRSAALFGVTGARARGDVAYRYSRLGTIGLSYSFDHYSFTKAFGGSDIHTISLLQAQRLSRYWEYSLMLGATRVETLGVARIQLDPAVAAIIGQSVGLRTAHLVNYVPNAKLKITRAFRQAALNFGYSRGVNPGNGIYLTSAHESVDASYSYRGIRRWNLHLGASYNSYSSLVMTLGKYRNFRAGAGATYRLMESVHLTSRLDGRKYLVDNSLRPDFDRVIYRATLGITFSPGDIPLALW